MPRGKRYRREQAVAIFLSIRRRKGVGAAKKFGRKHRSSFRKRGASVRRGRRR